jgi:hypothetical protein
MDLAYAQGPLRGFFSPLVKTRAIGVRPVHLPDFSYGTVTVNSSGQWAMLRLAPRIASTVTATEMSAGKIR